jgi:hypothetical protein
MGRHINYARLQWQKMFFHRKQLGVDYNVHYFRNLIKMWGTKGVFSTKKIILAFAITRLWGPMNG